MTVPPSSARVTSRVRVEVIVDTHKYVLPTVSKDSRTAAAIMLQAETTSSLKRLFESAATDCGDKKRQKVAENTGTKTQALRQSKKDFIVSVDNQRRSPLLFRLGRCPFFGFHFQF